MPISDTSANSQKFSKSSSDHLFYLDSLRALAAIYVVIHHAVLHYYPSIKDLSDYKLTFVQSILFRFLKHGYYAVDFFIVLSGFSLMLSVIKNNYFIKGGRITFIKRRIIRIVPPYYSAILFSLLLIWLLIGNKTGTQWDAAIPVGRRDIIRHLLMIHDFYYSSFPRINDVLWSVAVEFRIYLFFPVLVFFWRRFGPFKALCFSIVISISASLILLWAYTFNKNIDITDAGLSPYIILFTLGMLTAEFSYSTTNMSIRLRKYYINNSFKIIILFSVLFVLSIFILKEFLKLNVNIFTDAFSKKLLDILMGILFSFILFGLSISWSRELDTNWLIKFFSWKPLVWVGTFSYSLYLVHSPILQLISKYCLSSAAIDESTKSYYLIISGTSISIIVAYFFYLICERPFLLLKRNKHT